MHVDSAPRADSTINFFQKLLAEAQLHPSSHFRADWAMAAVHEPSIPNVLRPQKSIPSALPFVGDETRASSIIIGCRLGKTTVALSSRLGPGLAHRRPRRERAARTAPRTQTFRARTDDAAHARAPRDAGTRPRRLVAATMGVRRPPVERHPAAPCRQDQPHAIDRRRLARACRAASRSVTRFRPVTTRKRQRRDFRVRWTSDLGASTPEPSPTLRRATMPTTTISSTRTRSARR